MTAKTTFSEELWKVSRKMRPLFDARVHAEGLPLPEPGRRSFSARRIA